MQRHYFDKTYVKRKLGSAALHYSKQIFTFWNVRNIGTYRNVSEYFSAALRSAPKAVVCAFGKINKAHFNIFMNRT